MNVPKISLKEYGDKSNLDPTKTSNPIYNISIIVPIFNVEEYIEQCCESLFNQSMKEGIEYIFINDKTTDNSIKILLECIEKYPEKKKQIKIINHIENKGIAYSRQEGINNSLGKYILYVDPDDWIHKDYCLELFQEANKHNADCVICDYFEVSNYKCIPRIIKLDSLSSEAMLSSISGRNNKSWGVLWNKMIRREVFLQYKFEPGINMCEDVLIMFKIFSENRKIRHIPSKLYYYRKNRFGSEKKKINENNLNQDITLFNIINKLSNISSSREYKLSCKSFIQEQIISRAFRYSKLSDSDFKNTYKTYFEGGHINNTFPNIMYYLTLMSTHFSHKVALSLYSLLSAIFNKVK